MSVLALATVWWIYQTLLAYCRPDGARSRNYWHPDPSRTRRGPRRAPRTRRAR